MTDPRQQADAQLAAILTTETIDRLWGEITGPYAMNFSRVEGRSVIKVLIDSHRVLAERLAEAERENDRLKAFCSAAIATGGKLNGELAAAQATIARLKSVLETVRLVQSDPIINAPYGLAQVHGWTMPEEQSKLIIQLWERINDALATPDHEAADER